LKVVKAFSAINQGGDNPAGNEDANDREAEIRKVVVQTANGAPEPAFETKLLTD
jgi:hypothetical protein